MTPIDASMVKDIEVRKQCRKSYVCCHHFCTISLIDGRVIERLLQADQIYVLQKATRSVLDQHFTNAIQFTQPRWLFLCGIDIHWGSIRPFYVANSQIPKKAKEILTSLFETPRAPLQRKKAICIPKTIKESEECYV